MNPNGLLPEISPDKVETIGLSGEALAIKLAIYTHLVAA